MANAMIFSGTTVTLERELNHSFYCLHLKVFQVDRNQIWILQKIRGVP